MTNLEGRVIRRRQGARPARPASPTTCSSWPTLADRLGAGEHVQRRPRDRLRGAAPGQRRAARPTTPASATAGSTTSRASSGRARHAEPPRHAAAVRRAVRHPRRPGPVPPRRARRRPRARPTPTTRTCSPPAGCWPSTSRARRPAAPAACRWSPPRRAPSCTPTSPGGSASAPDDVVELTTRRGRARFHAHVTDTIRPDVVFAPFHWGGGSSANALTDPALDPISRMPAFKVCAVAVARVDGPAEHIAAARGRHPAAADGPPATDHPRAPQPVPEEEHPREEHPTLPARRLPDHRGGADQARPDRPRAALHGAERAVGPGAVLPRRQLHRRAGLRAAAARRRADALVPDRREGRRPRAAPGGRGPARRHASSSCTPRRPRASPASSSSTSGWWRSDDGDPGWPPRRPDVRCTSTTTTSTPAPGWSSSATAWPAPASSRRCSSAAAASSSGSPSSATSRTATTTGSCCRRCWPARSTRTTSSSTATTGTPTTASRLRAGVRAERIDTAAKLVYAADGTATPYDHLVLATGSYSFIPPMKGVRDRRRRPAARRLRVPHHRRDPGACSTPIGRCKRAVVMGGGLLGPGGRPRAAGPRPARRARARHAVPDEHAARRRGRRDPQEERRVARHRRPPRRLRHRGDRHRPRRAASGSPTAGGSTPTCSSSPPASGRSTDIAVRSGLEVERGIVVDDQLRTDDPDVYAIGECAQHRGEVYGLVAPAWEHAKVLADVLTGTDPTAEYHGSRTATKLKVAGVDVAVMGINTPERDDDEFLVISEPQARGAPVGGHPRRQADRRHAARRHPQGRLPDPGLRPRAAPLPEERIRLLVDLSDGAEEVGVAEMPADVAGLQLQRRHQGRRSAARSPAAAAASARSWTAPAPARAAARASRWSSRSSSGPPTATCTEDPRRVLVRAGHPDGQAGADGRDPRAGPAQRLRRLRRARARRQRRRQVEDGPDLAAQDDLGRRLRPGEGRRVHQRPRARQHPARRHVLRRPADEGRGDHAGPAAEDRRRRREVRGADGEDHRRPADRPARRPQGGPAGHVGRPRHAVRATPTARACAR